MDILNFLFSTVVMYSFTIIMSGLCGFFICVSLRPSTSKESFNSIAHYKEAYKRQNESSIFYQARLFHSWESLRELDKGLKHQARKIIRLKKELISANQTIIDLRSKYEFEISPLFHGCSLEDLEAIQRQTS
jgi:uncharacterized LabA/DUF88 family protein